MPYLQIGDDRKFDGQIPLIFFDTVCTEKTLRDFSWAKHYRNIWELAFVIIILTILSSTGKFYIAAI
jgi:hypothetical protein